LGQIEEASCFGFAGTRFGTTVTASTVFGGIVEGYEAAVALGLECMSGVVAQNALSRNTKIIDASV
jgi:hypothetical protein